MKAIILIHLSRAISFADLTRQTQMRNLRKFLSARKKRRNLHLCRTSFHRSSPMVRHRPLALFVETSSRCNLNCIMCARTFDPRFDRENGETGDLSPETFRLIEPLFGPAVKAYLMGNGEPLMNPRFPQMLERIKRRHVYVSFNTNGTLITERLAEHLVKLAVDEVVFSIDSVEPAEYERIRRGAGYDRLITGILQLNEEKRHRDSPLPSLILACVAMTTNYREFPDIVTFACHHGFEHVHFESLIRQDDSRYREFYEIVTLDQVPRGEVEESIAKARQIALRHDIGMSTSLYDGSSAPEGFSCSEPWTTLFVTWNGTLRACCQSERALGQLGEKDVLEIWRGREMNELREVLGRGEIPTSCRCCVKNRRWRNIIPEMTKLLEGR